MKYIHELGNKVQKIPFANCIIRKTFYRKDTKGTFSPSATCRLRHRIH